MSRQTLTDPVLGTLDRGPSRYPGGVKWSGRAWLTPKHRVAVAYDQWYPEAGDAAEQTARARDTYQHIRQNEWEIRLLTAARLDEGSPRPPAALARAMVLVRVVLFGDGSAHAVYDAPPPFHEREIWAGVEPDGSFDFINQFEREETP